MTVCWTPTMKQILIWTAIFLVLITENEAGHEHQCISILYDVFGRDPSVRTAVRNSFNTGLDVDGILSRPGATAFAVSARAKTTHATFNNLRYFVQIGPTQFGPPVYMFGGNNAKITMWFVVENAGRVIPAFAEAPTGVMLQGGVEFDFLWVIIKSPRRSQLWINGVEIRHSLSDTTLAWQSSPWYLFFDRFEEMSNVVIYDQIVTPTTKCTRCVPGEIPPTCQPCSAGKYLLAGANQCSNCPSNADSPVRSTLLTQCVCNAGYSGTNGNTCTACAGGKYKTHSGSAICIDCPPFSNSPLASTVITQCSCNVGYAGPAGGTCALPKCGAGSTGPDGGPCVCVAGKYKSNTGTAECMDCEAGKYSNVIGATSNLCQACRSNSVSAIASDEVTDCMCNAGWTGSGGDEPCSACIAGTYKSSIGSEACENCIAGTYSDTLGSVTSDVCRDCPSNSDAAEASDGPVHCICNAGFSGVRGEPCTQCPIAKYRAAP